MVFNANFNNISAISWRSVLLVEETGGHGENHRPVASDRQTLSHNVVSSTPWLSLPMVDDSLRALRLLPPLKLVVMILLKVALNTKNQSINQSNAHQQSIDQDPIDVIRYTVKHVHKFSVATSNSHTQEILL